MTILEARDGRTPEKPPFYTLETLFVEEPLSDYSFLRLERVWHPGIEIGGAVARWGKRYPKDEIDAIIAERFGQENVAGFTGFNELWRVPQIYTPDQAIEEETAMIKRLVAATLEVNKWQEEDVDALYFGGSPPHHPKKELIYPDYGLAIAQATGLTHLNPRNYYLACNSGGRALKEALINPELCGKNVLVLTVEGLTKQISGFDPKKADPFSLQVFSDGAAALGVVPGKTLTYLLGEFKAVRDKGALAAVAPWKDLIDPQGELIQKVGNIMAIQLPQPPEGMQISMEGGATTKLFLRNLPPVVANVYRQHAQEYPGVEMNLAVAHHASGQVGKGVRRFLARRFGITEEDFEIPWVVNDGNSSGATTLMAFVRLLGMGRFNPGDHLMIISFGAGISIDVFVVKIGGG